MKELGGEGELLDKDGNRQVKIQEEMCPVSVPIYGKIWNVYEVVADSADTQSVNMIMALRGHFFAASNHLSSGFLGISFLGTYAFVLLVVEVITALSGFFDLYGTHFVLRYLCRGVVRRIGKDVGASFSEVEGHEHHPLVNSVGQDYLGGDLAPP